MEELGVSDKPQSADVQKYETHINKLESELSEARDMIRRQEAENCELVESVGGVFSPREVGVINAAFQMIGMCQNVLQGQHVCGESGCSVVRRELIPEESAAFTAACDMLSRLFDGEFQLSPGRGPEAE
jgi:hypothetical protein